MARGHGGAAKGSDPRPKAKPLAGRLPDGAAVDAEGKRLPLKAKLRAWREAHPEWQDKPGNVSKKELREYFEGLAPDAVDRIEAILANPKHPRNAEVAMKIIEHKIGKPEQAVEFGGKDGAPLIIQVVKFGTDSPQLAPSPVPDGPVGLSGEGR